ncbi:MAG: hypothetical protein HY076_05355 [Candidatus Eisenbacteria bacterium]|uniref:Transporter n=1 Tax=Eiseniibacteriota bacterium TaxID=2212470 RepID=A0A9D6L9W1_UNCEI|nr:hypothetical protein [Candidatus Eisenbacteria bacterium]
MNRRMMTILVLGALLLALPAVALAQTSRVEGMALQGDFLKDVSGMFTYTSQVANVGNLVYGELGNTNSFATRDRAVGAVIGTLWDGKMGTWAVHLHEQRPQIGQGTGAANPAPGLLGADPNTNTHSSFDLMWGKKFGTTSFGVRVDRAFTSLEGDLFTLLGPTSLEKIEGDAIGPAALNRARNVFGFGAGLGFEMSPTSNAEVSFKYESRTFTESDSAGTPGGTTVSEDHPTAYQLAARTMWQWTSNVMIIPVFKWYSYDLGIKTTPGATVSSDLKGWQLGAAGNWTLGSNDLFVLGVNFAQNKLEQNNVAQEITETLMPQVFAALETHVNSWLTLRFGARNSANSRIELKDNAAPTKVVFKGSDFAMNLGVGTKFGPLQVDAVLNDDFPHVGPWFISGQNTGSALFPKVTATYPF